MFALWCDMLQMVPN